MRPITNGTIVDFVRRDGRDPADIAAIVEHLAPLDFSSAGRQAWIRSFTILLVRRYNPAYAPILFCLFVNTSSSAILLRIFALTVVQLDRQWIISFINATRANINGVQPISDAIRRTIIEALILEYIEQYDDTAVRRGIAKDTIPALIRLLENCRTNNDPARILYAVKEVCDRRNPAILSAVVTKYRGDADYLKYITNGIIKSSDGVKFTIFNDILRLIGTDPGPGTPVIKVDGTQVQPAEFPGLKREAAYSLSTVYLPQVLANLAQVPDIEPFLQPIRDAIAAVTADSDYPAVFTGLPPHYIQLVTGGAPPKTFAERAVEEGNYLLVVRLIAANVDLSTRNLMSIALKDQDYNIASRLWRQNNRYPDPWFPPNFVFDEKKLFAEETDERFRKDFAAKYALANPGWAGFYTTVGRAVGSGPAYTSAPLDRAAQETVADNVISILNGMPDFVPQNTDRATIDLKKLSTIRDELQRVADPAVWNSKMLLPLIAKKGACAFGVVLPNADLIKTAISVGADPNIVDADGKAALHHLTGLPVAKEYARLRTPRAILMLKSLLAAPTLDVNLPSPGSRDTALHLILEKQQPSKEFLDLLSKVNGIDFDVVNTAGDSPLHHLIKTRPTTGTTLKDSNDVLKIIVTKADMKILDANRHTALWSAIDTVTNDEYMASIIPLLAKGLTDTTAEVTLIGGKAGLPISARILTSLVPVLSGPPLVIPDWVPNNIKTILAGDSLDLSAKDVIMKHIVAVDAYINNGTPSDFESLMDLLKSRYGPPSIWESFRQRVAPDEFTVKFNNTDPPIRLMSPYDPSGSYRDLATTVYTSSGTPTLAAGTDPAAVTAAARNNDVLVKLVGRQYITPVHQPILKKILKELYHADANPSLGNDLTTLITNLFMKFETMEKADKAIQKHGKAKALAKLESSLTTFVGILLAGGRFPPSLPDALPFPAIVFTGRATHAPLFAAAAAVAGGGIPMMPGLRAITTVPPPRPGLRSGSSRTGSGGSGSGSGGPPPSSSPALINTITGEPIDPRILATDFPTDITLGSEDALTYATPPLTVVSGFEVARSDPFYKFLQPFGLTAVFGGKAYILRPAELFLALFHKTQPQVAAIMRDGTHPIVILLRDICLPAAAQLAQRKGMTDSVTKLNVLRGRLPR